LSPLWQPINLKQVAKEKQFMSPDVFFDNWPNLLRTVAVGVPAYLILLLLLRISGKRTLSKMNAFDLVVTVALGSTLATVLLSKDVALAEGVTALAMLIVLQFIITWLTVRSNRVNQWVKSDPRLLFYQGEFLHGAMKTERINEDEVRQAIRGQGISSVSDVYAVVIETDGSLNVTKRSDHRAGSALANVEGHAEVETVDPAGRKYSHPSQNPKHD
jgi:uncharacterized membrane protein YcaP (DUF421 family)